jgi:hypothetical protein
VSRTQHNHALRTRREQARKTLRNGDVESFELTGHPKACRCYGWSQGEPEEFITIIGMPSVKTAHDAVKMALAYQAKQAMKGK